MENQTGMYIDPYGEIHTNGIWLTEEQIIKEQELKEKRRRYFEHMKKKDNLFIQFNEVLGSFYFVNYIKLLPLINDDTALAFRYLYLCTYADKEGRLFYKGKPVLHKDFRRILELNRNLTCETVEKLENLGLIYDIDNYYYVNLAHYIRSQKLPNDFKGNSSRMIDHGIQELYKQSTPRKHAMLGKIVPLLEYINKYNNILCTKETILEHEHKKVQPLTAVEICKICGRSPQNSDVFIKELRSFVIDRLPFVRRIVDNTEYKLDCYIINPYVVYMGSRNDHLEWTFKLFDLKNKR